LQLALNARAVGIWTKVTARDASSTVASYSTASEHVAIISTWAARNDLECATENYHCD